MTQRAADQRYADVPPDQRQQLASFRAAHPDHHCTSAGVRWHYLAGGNGETPLLLLPGAALRAEPGFPLIAAFEQHRRVIAPSYPPVRTMDATVRGLAAILATEGIPRAHVFGGSYGGLVAQSFARAYPERTRSLIVANTSAPSRHWRWPATLLLPALSLIPLGLVHALVRRALPRTMVAPPHEQAFWRAYQEELLAHHLDRVGLLAMAHAATDALRHRSSTAPSPTHWQGSTLLLGTAPATLRRRYPSAAPHLFHNAGHTPWLTDTGGYVATVERFMVWAESRELPPA